MYAFHPPRQGRVLPVLLLGAAGVLSGCRPAEVKLLPVHGKVLVGDKPVKEGTVSFRPDGARGNMSPEHPTGVLQDDGSFELLSGGRPGAAPGWYRVLVIADNFKVIEPPPSPVWPRYPEGFLPKPLVNERYLYFKTTDLLVEVVEDPDEGAYVLKLKP